MKKYLLFLAACLCILFKAQIVYSQSDASAKIIILRPFDYGSAFVAMTTYNLVQTKDSYFHYINFDNHFFGNVLTKTYYEIEVDPGTYTIDGYIGLHGFEDAKTSGKGYSLTINAEPGMTYYACIDEGKDAIKLIDKKHWEKELKKKYYASLRYISTVRYRDGVFYDSTGLVVNNNPVSIETTSNQNIPTESPTKSPAVSSSANISDVDKNIPSTKHSVEDVFALVISNENYQHEVKVPFAGNDGNVFCKYLKSTFGVPEQNIHYVADATYNNMKYHINWLKKIMSVYGTDAKIVFYYAGHGIPDESNKSAYLLPVDGFATDVSTGFKLDDLYSQLSEFPSKSVTVLLDACFSGAKREGGMIASARGVAIKAKQGVPTGNMVVLSAAQGDETAYPDKEKYHGLFTYYLLKKLQETSGKVTLGELSDYVIKYVSRQSVVVNGKTQTPMVNASSQVGTLWRDWTLR